MPAGIDQDLEYAIDRWADGWSWVTTSESADRAMETARQLEERWGRARVRVRPRGQYNTIYETPEDGD